MNPLFEKAGLTPTAAIAARAAGKEAAEQARAKMKEARDAAGITSLDDIKNSIKRSPPKLGPNGQPEPVVRKWPK